MLAYLFASIAPLLLWPLELFLPYPHILEEFVKVFIALYIVKSKIQRTLMIAFLSGLLFAFSESVLYLFNIIPSGSYETILTRLALTIPLHTTTMLIITVGAIKNKYLAFVGGFIAIIVHYYFNSFLVNLF